MCRGPAAKGVKDIDGRRPQGYEQHEDGGRDAEADAPCAALKNLSHDHLSLGQVPNILRLVIGA